MRLLRALKPAGMLYLDEYVGPSRFDWNDSVLAPQQAFFSAIPEALRRVERIPFPIQADDPTEAIRSSAIEPAVRIGFDIAARRPYGGTLLSVVLPQLRSIDAALPYAIGCERALLAAGVPSFYAVIVAVPKRGLRKLVALVAYALANLRMHVSFEIDAVRDPRRPRR